MNEPLLTGLIGIVGPVLTFAVTKILEIFQKSQELRRQHEYSIQKSLFEKKIQAAESAVTQFDLIKSCVRSLRTFIDIVRNWLIDIGSSAFTGKLPSNQINIDSLKVMISNIQSLFDKINSEVISSASIFFDIKQDLGNIHSLEDGMMIISGIYASVNSIGNISESSHRKSTTKEDVESFMTLLELLKKMSEWLKSMEDDIDNNLRIIKLEMNL
jgi:hypothetical protein